MSDSKLDDLRDFALYGYKAYQDILYAALTENDIPTLRSVLNELSHAFDRFLERLELGTADILRHRLAHPNPGDDLGTLQARLDPLQKREDVARRLKLARDQVIFGLAARGLEILLSRDDHQAMLLPLNELIGRLPDSLVRLTEVFESANDDSVSQFWGWHWWDFQPDGKAHFVDTYSRPNRLYCVRGLQILANLDAAAIQNLRLPSTDDLVWLFDDGNARGVPAMLRQLQAEAHRLEGIIGLEQIARIEDFLAILSRTKAAQEDAREERLAAAPLAPEKVVEFKRNVVDALHEVGKLRPLLRKLGVYRDLTHECPDPEIRSWGYNQLDDKGAFIADWHVAYSRWGEAYGRGLAQSEDQTTFSTMIDAAQVGADIDFEDLIPTLEACLQESDISDPIVFKTMQTMLEYGDIHKKELFVPRYHRDCPQTPVSNLDGFAGVLKFSVVVPIFNVFVQDPEYRDKVLIANVPRFIRWDQLSPTDAGEDNQADVMEAVLIRVIDLNQDVQRRRRLIEENPLWLHDQLDKEKFLRTHVVVKVYQRFKLTVLDNLAAIRLSVRRPA